MEYFLRNPERVLSKTMILQRLWDYSFDPQTNVVDVLVCRLRNKIDRDFPAKLIQTLRGVGYVLRKKVNRRDLPARRSLRGRRSGRSRSGSAPGTPALFCRPGHPGRSGALRDPPRRLSLRRGRRPRATRTPQRGARASRTAEVRSGDRKRDPARRRARPRSGQGRSRPHALPARRRRGCRGPGVDIGHQRPAPRGRLRREPLEAARPPVTSAVLSVLIGCLLIGIAGGVILTRRALRPSGRWPPRRAP